MCRSYAASRGPSFDDIRARLGQSGKELSRGRRRAARACLLGCRDLLDNDRDLFVCHATSSKSRSPAESRGAQYLVALLVSKMACCFQALCNPRAGEREEESLVSEAAPLALMDDDLALARNLATDNG